MLYKVLSPISNSFHTKVPFFLLPKSDGTAVLMKVTVNMIVPN